LPLSYDDVGIAERSPPGYDVDECIARIGQGEAEFERAKTALTEWKHFALGWVELFPPGAAIEPGTVVAVLVRHFAVWSLNGCRILYTTGEREGVPRFGFAYGTLTNHAEKGEEIFEVAITPETGEVTYRIRAVSKPRALLARAGYPVARRLQARFRRDSTLAMQRAVAKVV
jgi:uncharacterized protein (UPF0548 family)